MMIKTVVFEFEDLLFDTAGVKNEAMEVCTRKHGKDLSKSFVSEFADQYRDKLLRDGKLSLKAGAKELLAYLKEEGITTVLTCADSSTFVTKLLKDEAAFELFDHLVFAGEYDELKPAARMIFKALTASGTKPENCLCLEANKNGIEAAVKAECLTVLVNSSERMLKMVKEADHRATSLMDVLVQLKDGRIACKKCYASSDVSFIA